MQVSIRFIEKSDLKTIAILANDKEIAAMTASLPYPYAVSDAHTWYDYIQNTAHEHVYAICANETIVGVIGLVHEAEHSRAELGYWLGKVYWGKGYATSAAEMIVGYAFSALGVNKVYAKCFGVNDASRRVLTKNGFVLEGTLRQHYMRMGKIQDMLHYGLLREDFETAH